MIRSVAGQIGDDAQSMTYRRGAIAEGDLPSTRSIQSYAGLVPSQHESIHAVTVTMEELSRFSFEKLHTAPHPKTLDWDLENEKIDATTSPALHGNFRQYCKALEALAKPIKGAGKGAGKAKPPSAVLDAFRKHCCALGVKFTPDRHHDVINLLAAVQSRLRDVH